MRALVVLLSTAIVASVAARAQDDCRCWTPNAQQIAALEAKINGGAIPLGNLDRYARFYAGVIDNGRMIRGELVRGVLVEQLGTKPGTYVVTEAELPLIMDGGCDVLHLTYDPAAKRIISSRCGGR